MKKPLRCCFAVALLCPLFAACGNKEQPDPATGSSETTVQTEPPEDAPDYAALETLGDISGEFRILFGYGFKQNDFKAAEESSTALESAIYRRNAYMKEKYNIDIVTDEMDSRTQAYDKLFAEYNAGDSTYDAAMMRTAEVAKLASGGCLRDLNEMPHLDLTKDYWDQRANADLSIGGRMYYTTGDIGVVDNMCTHCMLFNKEMVRQYGFDDPYELVKDDKWTLETLGTMVRAVGEDANQDGIYDENDVYGLLTWLDNVQAILEDYCLLKRKTVRENVEYPLKIRSLDLTPAQNAIREFGLASYADIKAAKIPEHVKPYVAVARLSLVKRDIYLFDDILRPLSGDDKELFLRKLKEIFSKLDGIIVYATSDIDEAKFLADKIAIIYGGVIEQYGTYDELRNKPLSRKVAEYFDDKIELRPSVLREFSGRLMIRYGDDNVTLPEGSAAKLLDKRYVGREVSVAPYRGGDTLQYLILDPSTDKTIVKY